MFCFGSSPCLFIEPTGILPSGSLQRLRFDKSTVAQAVLLRLGPGDAIQLSGQAQTFLRYAHGIPPLADGLRVKGGGSSINRGRADCEKRMINTSVRCFGLHGK